MITHKNFAIQYLSTDNREHLISYDNKKRNPNEFDHIVYLSGPLSKETLFKIQHIPHGLGDLKADILTHEKLIKFKEKDIDKAQLEGNIKAVKQHTMHKQLHKTQLAAFESYFVRLYNSFAAYLNDDNLMIK
jgi:hypothetical protein